MFSRLTVSRSSRFAFLSSVSTTPPRPDFSAAITTLVNKKASSSFRKGTQWPREWLDCSHYCSFLRTFQESPSREPGHRVPSGATNTNLSTIYANLSRNSHGPAHLGTNRLHKWGLCRACGGRDMGAGTLDADGIMKHGHTPRCRENRRDRRISVNSMRAKIFEGATVSVRDLFMERDNRGTETFGPEEKILGLLPSSPILQGSQESHSMGIK